MEKRVLLAFLLSFVVLSVWTTIFPPPRPQVTTNTQVIENKQDKEELAVSESSEAPPPAPVLAKEDIIVLENAKLRVELTNIGGSIKSIVLKEYSSEESRAEMTKDGHIFPDMASLPVEDIFAIEGLEKTIFAADRSVKDKITFTAQTKHGRITKSYRLSEKDYLIEANVQSDKMSNLEIVFYKADIARIDKKTLQSPERSLFEYSVGLTNRIIRKHDAVHFSDKERKEESAEVSWVGFRNRYYCTIIKPDFKTSQVSILPEGKEVLKIKAKPLSAGEKLSSGAVIYAGPQKLALLSSYNQGFENIMVFSNYGILDIVAKMIYYFLHFLQDFLKNWGVAILVLGFTIFVATYPLTAKSMSSMKKMQVLQPKLKALQEKYKNDAQRLNKEMMELYKTEGVNPFGGCLPMILQMPIFLGLYQVLWRAVDLKGAQFLWIKDLSQPDRLATLPFNIPFIGNELNILPILMAIVMFFQQKLSAKNMVMTDPAQVMQQKMMMVVFPIMLGFIFYHFASGLALYFTLFYLMSTLAQWKMSKVSGTPA